MNEGMKQCLDWRESFRHEHVAFVEEFLPAMKKMTLLLLQ
jgi:hypothetical protein